VVVGDECFVGEHAVVNAGVKIYPFKTVDADAVVNSSIVWESRGTRTLFGPRGIRGLANVDITPEVAVRVAMAYGTALKRRSVVVTTRDTSRVARALKRAVIGGLNLAGANVEDLELATVPLTRFQVRNGEGAGGITVRLVPGDPDSVELRFFDADGRDIDEGLQRKIERLLSREDYRRAFAGDIGDIAFPPRSIEFYTAALEQTLDLPRLRERKFKVVVDYSFGAASIVMPSVLAKLGAEVLAVNPYAHTVGSSESDLTRQLGRLGELVRASGSDLGAVISPDGETVAFVDDAGHGLSHTETMLALVTLVCEVHERAHVAVPVSVTREVQRIVTAHHGSVVWTKRSDAHLMEVASAGAVDFAASPVGGYIWPDFIPAYDATATLARMLDLLAAVRRPLSTIVKTLPPVHMVHEVLPTPWERKGTVMRALVEESEDEELVLIDGVKIVRENGWALVLPDPEHPATHVWAEADTEPAARALAQEQAAAILRALQS
jgi:mannose-1-phosphate guanylyltransferase/phosphomannomutase